MKNELLMRNELLPVNVPVPAGVIDSRGRIKQWKLKPKIGERLGSGSFRRVHVNDNGVPVGMPGSSVLKIMRSDRWIIEETMACNGRGRRNPDCRNGLLMPNRTTNGDRLMCNLIEFQLWSHVTRMLERMNRYKKSEGVGSYHSYSDEVMAYYRGLKRWLCPVFGIYPPGVVAVSGNDAGDSDVGSGGDVAGGDVAGVGAGGAGISDWVLLMQWAIPLDSGEAIEILREKALTGNSEFVKCDRGIDGRFIDGTDDFDLDAYLDKRGAPGMIREDAKTANFGLIPYGTPINKGNRGTGVNGAGGDIPVVAKYKYRVVCIDYGLWESSMIQRLVIDLERIEGSKKIHEMLYKEFCCTSST